MMGQYFSITSNSEILSQHWIEVRIFFLELRDLHKNLYSNIHKNEMKYLFNITNNQVYRHVRKKIRVFILYWDYLINRQVTLTIMSQCCLGN